MRVWRVQVGYRLYLVRARDQHEARGVVLASGRIPDYYEVADRLDDCLIHEMVPDGEPGILTEYGLD